MLLIHGLGSNAKGWLRNIPDLVAGPPRDRRRPARLRQVGQGLLRVLPALLRPGADGVADGLGVDKATWVGHSMGGQIALVAALDDPDRRHAAWCWFRRRASKLSPTVKATG